MLFRHIVFRRVFVAFFDQEPLFFRVALGRALLAAGADQSVHAAQLEAVHLQVELAGAYGVGSAASGRIDYLVLAAIPDNHRTNAIIPFRNGTLEVRVFDRMVLDYSDEVRPAEDVDQAENEPVKETELTLAKRLIDELTEKNFDPSKYHDHYRERVLEVAQQKVAGQQVTEASPEARRGQVIDLMSALKASLEKRGVAAVADQGEAAAQAEKSRAPRTARRSSEGRRAGGKK